MFNHMTAVMINLVSTVKLENSNYFVVLSWNTSVLT